MSTPDVQNKQPDIRSYNEICYHKLSKLDKLIKQEVKRCELIDSHLLAMKEPQVKPQVD